MLYSLQVLSNTCAEVVHYENRVADYPEDVGFSGSVGSTFIVGRSRWTMKNEGEAINKEHVQISDMRPLLPISSHLLWEPESPL